MSKFLDRIIERAKADKKTIVLAEGTEPRTIAAADIEAGHRKPHYSRE